MYEPKIFFSSTLGPSTTQSSSVPPRLYSSLFNNANNIWCRLQIMNVIM